MEGNRLDLAKYRMELAEEKLKAAKDLLSTKSYRDSVSRSYYAMLHAARALLATKGLDAKKHSGVISLFNQHFVKEGIVNREAGSRFIEAKELREDSDYEELAEITKQDAEDTLESAKIFLEEIKKVLRCLTGKGK